MDDKTLYALVKESIKGTGVSATGSSGSTTHLEWARELGGGRCQTTAVAFISACPGGLIVRHHIRRRHHDGKQLARAETVTVCEARQLPAVIEALELTHE
jgi:hypothetical protein